MTFHPEDLSEDSALSDCQAENAHLRRALASRPVIDQAKGILMAQHGCSAEEAFDMLSQASQRSNRKLNRIAEAIIAKGLGRRHETGGSAA